MTKSYIAGGLFTARKLTPKSCGVYWTWETLTSRGEVLLVLVRGAARWKEARTLARDLNLTLSSTEDGRGPSVARRRQGVLPELAPPPGLLEEAVKEAP